MLLFGVDHWASPCILPGLQGFSKTLKVRGSKAAKSRLVRDILKPLMIFRPLTPNTTLFPTEFMTQSTLSKLSGRHITLAITGGIAVYKVCELVRSLVKAGATVEVAMTEAATRFVTPLTFEALSGHPVAVDQFAGGMPHLALTRHDTANRHAYLHARDTLERLVSLDVVPIVNDFFGHTIDVAGLVTGGDLIRQLKGRELGERVLIPHTMLRHGEGVFLDDVTLEQASTELGVPVTPIGGSGDELLAAMLGTEI